MYTQQSRVFQSVRFVLPMSSSERRREAIKRIMVERAAASRNLSLKRVNSKIRKNRPINKSTKSIGRKIVTEYLQDSSVHGVQYFTNLRIRPSIVGKVFWILVMILSLAFLIWMIKTLWEHYTDHLLRSVIDTFHAPIFTIPFPAVTICPAVAALPERRKAMLDRLRLPNSIDNATAWFLLNYLGKLTKGNNPANKKHLKDLATLLNANNITRLEIIKYLRPCEDLVESCWWNRRWKNCSEILKVSRTSNSLCCSFNFLLEDYIRNNKNVESIEYLRSANFGPMTGLVITLHRKLLEEDDETRNSVKYIMDSNGVLVYCHHPMEYLNPIADAHLLQAGQELGIGINPEINLKLSDYTVLDSKGRLIPQCVKDSDVKLKYFPMYLITNCFVECSIKVSLNLCGCVPYYYELMAIKHSLKICNSTDLKCLYDNADYILMIEAIYIEKADCNCFIPCRNIYYNTLPSLSLLNSHESNTWPIHKNLSKSQAILRVYLTSETITIHNMMPTVNNLNLLAALGGVFSLFLGCSFISVVELFYFIGLYFRSYYNSKKSK